MWTSIKSFFIKTCIPWVMKSENQKLIADLAQKAVDQIKK